MQVGEIVQALSLTVRAGREHLNREATGGYAADLLSCAMAAARQGDVWVTLQGHLNVIAVASLNELAAIIVAENKPVSPEALEKAEEEGIPILTTGAETFEVCGRLWQLGLRA